MIDYTLQRKNMVESQVRPADVTDRRIIRAMLAVPRERFVPAALRSIAYMDEAVPLKGADGAPRAMLGARIVAKLMQLMELGDSDVVLEIGAGSGYSAAVLARIAQTVVALEQDATLAAEATATLAKFEVDNVAVVTGPHASGYPSEGPYDAILISGAVAEVPAEILDQLKDGGRLVAIAYGPGSVGRAVQWRRMAGTYDRREVFDAGAPALPGFERKQEFVF